MTDAAPAAPKPERFSPYQWRLFLFLSVATFFEGYDFMALTQLISNFGAPEVWDLDRAEKGYLVTFINLGTVLAYVLVRRADDWGRKRVLTITIVGYTIFTGLSGLAPGVYWFAGIQLVARTFLIAEWAIAMVIAAEEFPASRRGMVIGVILAFNSLGAIVCAGVVPVLLELPVPGLEPAERWRSAYFVGVVPLVLIAFARRSLRETRRFEELKATIDPKRSLLHIFRTPYRKRLLQMSAIWLLTYVCTHNAVTFWKDFVLQERGFTNSQAGNAIAIAAIAAMPLVFLSGRLLDWIGRRRAAIVIFILGALGIAGCYGLHGFWPMTGALVFGIYGSSAVPQVLNAFTTELFPTSVRGDAFAWANNLIGRIGYVFSPAAVGTAANSVGWGPAVTGTVVFLLAGLVLILVMLPETRGRELEETAAV